MTKIKLIPSQCVRLDEFLTSHGFPRKTVQEYIRSKMVIVDKRAKVKCSTIVFPGDEIYIEVATNITRKKRLDKFLVSRGFSRKTAQEYIKNKMVTVNKSTKIKCSTIVSPDDEICVEVAANTAPKNVVRNIDIPIEYEDEYFCVINKPAGVLSHPGEGKECRFCVTDFIREKYGALNVGEDPTRPGIVHRLDKNTSGLMIIAKQNEVYHVFKKMMAEREIVKKYFALVYGNMRPDTGMLRSFIAHDKNNYRKMIISKYNHNNAREAITLYATVKSWPHFSFLECDLQTGRTHQIRAQLSNAGCGVVGDNLYGKNRAIKKLLPPQDLESIVTFNRHALHACGLQFTHPITGQIINVESKLPEDFKQLIINLKLSA